MSQKTVKLIVTETVAVARIFQKIDNLMTNLSALIATVTSKYENMLLACMQNCQFDCICNHHYSYNVPETVSLVRPVTTTVTSMYKTMAVWLQP